jgi:hypothetical protein
VLPVHFSWMWESPLRITSHASGAWTNLWLKCRVPRRRCQYPPTQIPTDDRACVIAGAAAEDPHSSAEALVAETEERQTRYPLDPNVVIAAAFKAAGLPVPEIPTAPPGATPRVVPGPIIAAALKAAGLMQS